MKYYKTLNDGYLVCVGVGSGDTEITEPEYNELLSIIHDRPVLLLTGFDYKLKTDNLEWELVELSEPSEYDDTDATEYDYITALQDLGVNVDAEG